MKTELYYMPQGRGKAGRISVEQRQYEMAMQNFHESLKTELKCCACLLGGMLVSAAAFIFALW